MWRFIFDQSHCSYSPLENFAHSNQYDWLKYKWSYILLSIDDILCVFFFQIAAQIAWKIILVTTDPSHRLGFWAAFVVFLGLLDFVSFWYQLFVSLLSLSTPSFSLIIFSRFSIVFIFVSISFTLSISASIF